MSNKLKFWLCILILLAVSLFLYHLPLFSNKPLGLDTLAHLSKVSYLKEFGSVRWDMSWYNGGPFLRFYPPLFYYFVVLFSNYFFGSNLACFLSILFCSIGIFLVVNNYSKKYLISLFAALSFISIINIHYYWIVVGNQPFIFALWTVPFSLYYLEKSFLKRIYFLPYSLVFLVGILSHIFVGLCISLIVFIRILFYGELKIKKTLKGLIFILIPIGISSFWAIPFFTHSSSFVGEDIYFPSILSLLGLKLSQNWGIGVDSIGIIFMLSFFLLLSSKKELKNRHYLYIFLLTLALFLLSLGILGKYYPKGIGSIRFIPMFSVFLSILFGMSLSYIKPKFYLPIGLFLILALYLNYNVITDNYNNHSYDSDDLKYGKFINIYKEFYTFNFVNESYAYRFGSARFPFTKSLNYVFPRLPQTGGYYDQGILYENTFYNMKEGIWYLNSTNRTLYYLDWFGIKYFELSGGYLDSEWKFLNSNFKLTTTRNSSDFPYKIYEYKKAKPIFSVIKTNFVSFNKSNLLETEKMADINCNTECMIPFISKKNISILNNYSADISRIVVKNPDKIEVESYFDGENAILFREFYYSSWKAREYPSGKEIPVYRTANDMMLIIPEKGVKKVTIYQSLLFVDYFSIAVSIIFIIVLICYILFPQPLFHTNI